MDMDNLAFWQFYHIDQIMFTFWTFITREQRFCIYLLWKHKSRLFWQIFFHSREMNIKVVEETALPIEDVIDGNLDECFL